MKPTCEIEEYARRRLHVGLRQRGEVAPGKRRHGQPAMRYIHCSCETFCEGEKTERKSLRSKAKLASSKPR